MLAFIYQGMQMHGSHDMRSLLKAKQMKVQMNSKSLKAIKIIPYKWPLCQAYIRFKSDTDYCTTQNVIESKI